jgi:two-component system NarL family sensor kinase
MVPQKQIQSMHTLETQGLLTALEGLKDEIAETDPIPIHLEADADAAELLSKEAQKAVFSIAAEATANACKHARAGNIYLRLYKRGTSVIAEVEDDGTGFDMAEVKASMAERGRPESPDMWERAAAVNGELVVKSAPGEGTKVTLTVPVEAA